MIAGRGRRSALPQHASDRHINVTPLIDVVMCLIVFYLMVGQLALDRRGEVRLPRAEGDALRETADRAIIVSVLDGAVLVDGAERPADGVADAVAGRLAREPELPVELRADREADFAAVRPVLDALREAGVTRLRLITQGGVRVGEVS